jgi:hypothetical protein
MGCIKLHILDEQYKRTELKVSYINKKLTSDFCFENACRITLYAFCSNNPINRIDPDGRADFWVNGRVVGNDGVDDQRILVVKTETLTAEQLEATTGFIRTNTGNREAFQNDAMAYTNSIAIEPSAANRQAMVTEVSRDNGRGGTRDANNREYGGSIQNGRVVVAEPGAVANPQTDAYASINLPAGGSTFHSHPSGEVIVRNPPPPNTIGGGTETTHSFVQPPSPTDISNAGANTNYVFGRGNNNVYIYNSGGVQAVMPMRYFVNPRR